VLKGDRMCRVGVSFDNTSQKIILTVCSFTKLILVCNFDIFSVKEINTLYDCIVYDHRLYKLLNSLLDCRKNT
jgi:hypothetical protein